MAKAPVDEALAPLFAALPGQVDAAMDALDVPCALTHIFTLVQRANKYIDETAPWVLAKNEADKPRLNQELYNLCSALHLIAALLQFALPNTAPKMADQLGLTAEELNAPLHGAAAGSREGYAVHKGEALFPRIDVAKEIAYLEALGRREEGRGRSRQSRRGSQKRPGRSRRDHRSRARDRLRHLHKGRDAGRAHQSLRSAEREQEAAAPDRL